MKQDSSNSREKSKHTNGDSFFLMSKENQNVK